jgi:regulator of extracellular matrix RemA (YlzA/DUF370 family)
MGPLGATQTERKQSLRTQIPYAAEQRNFSGQQGNFRVPAGELTAELVPALVEPDGAPLQGINYERRRRARLVVPARDFGELHPGSAIIVADSTLAIVREDATETADSSAPAEAEMSEPAIKNDGRPLKPTACTRALTQGSVTLEVLPGRRPDLALALSKYVLDLRHRYKVAKNTTRTSHRRSRLA